MLRYSYDIKFYAWVAKIGYITKKSLISGYYLEYQLGTVVANHSPPLR